DRGLDAREIRFRVGALPPIDRPPERRIARTVPAERTVPPELARVLEGVGDPELRRAIESAAAANLAWQTVVRPAPPLASGQLTEAQRAVRAPRSSEGGSAPRGPASSASPAGRSGTRGGGP